MYFLSRVKSTLILVITALLLSACQDESVDSASASVGFQFPDSCADCHGDNPAYALLGARAGYDHSGHKLGFDRHETHSYYANGGGCQQCHTHEGFVNFVKTGKTDPDSFIQWPSQPSCFTCHNPHESGDFSLRTVAAVTLADGNTFDAGIGNLCATCHQARSAGTDVAKATPAEKVRSYFGPHHGPQANIFAGFGAFEFEGKSYTSGAHKLEVEDSCVSCHMSLPEGRFSSTASIGGHSFGMSGEVHGGEVVNLASCQGCHAGIKQVQGQPYYDIAASADYDADGKVEVAQLEVKGLLERLVNSSGTGLLQTMNPPMFNTDGSWNQVTKPGSTRTPEQMAALFNYKLVWEDRSLGIHNIEYTVQVLTDTIAALDGKFDTSNRPE